MFSIFVVYEARAYRVIFGGRPTVWRTLAYPTTNYWADLYQIFRIGRQVSGDDSTDTGFPIAQGTLPW